MEWRLTPLLALEETSEDCLRNYGCGLGYIFGFCVRLCTAFAHFVRLLRTYKALIFRMLCRFWVRIRLLCGFCVRIRLLLLLMLCSFCVCIWLLCTLCVFFVRIRILRKLCGFCVGRRLLSSQCSIWTVSRDPILGVPYIYFSVQTLVSCGYYWGIWYWGFRQFLLSARAASDYWTVLRDPILRVPSIYFVRVRLSWSTDRIPRRFLVGLDREILPCVLILLRTMLICGSYINIG